MAFVVTACPRSATRYTAVLLSRLGVRCSHESVFRPETSTLDVVRWSQDAQAGESSWLAWCHALPDSVRILHQRRDPWRVIDSLAHRNRILRPDLPDTEHQRKLRDLVAGFCPRLARYTNQVDRAAVLLLDWNARIEDAAPHRIDYRVEDLDVSRVGDLLEQIGQPRGQARIKDALAATATNENLGRVIERDAQISNPDVARWLREQFPGLTPKVQRVRPATEGRTQAELAEAMSPDLLTEVRDYAARCGYGRAQKQPNREGAAAQALC